MTSVPPAAIKNLVAHAAPFFTTQLPVTLSLIVAADFTARQYWQRSF